ncbi:MAG: metallophosphoesterase [Deltaproteobacteria bacterium]|nr:metallophosphoesterase [Deltaproteobacteria bacterium]
MARRGITPRCRSLRFAVASTFAASTALASPASAATSFTRGPYVQDLASRHVAIMFELDAAHGARLEVFRGATGEDADAGKTAKSNKDGAHEIVVDGLEPATSYRYVVTLDDGTVERGTFTTAPEDARPFSFLVYGDNRTNPYAHAAIVAAMRKTPGEFLVNTGDMVYDGTQQADWKDFFTIERDLLRDRCLFPAIGNHEIAMPTSDGALRYARMFRVPAPPEAAERWYTFRWGSARFFMLDAQDEFASAERAWLDKALEAAKNEAGVVFRFVVLHHGPYSSGLHGPNEALLLARVPELMRATKVDLVLSGHDHIYERGDANGLRYVVTGGGGAPIYREYRAAKHTQKFEPVYHFVKIGIDGARATYSAMRHDGSVIESCGFMAGTAGWACGPAGPPAAASGAVGSGTPSPTPPAPLPPEPARRACGCSFVSGGMEWLPLGLAGVLAAGAAVRPRRRPKRGEGGEGRLDESFREDAEARHNRDE